MASRTWITTLLLLLLSLTTLYCELSFRSFTAHQATNSITTITTTTSSSSSSFLSTNTNTSTCLPLSNASAFHAHLAHADPPPTALQQHILFWDRDNDGVIWPADIYTGFRAIGFNIPYALTALLIPIFFSYPTTLGHSYLPDPLFRIHVASIHKAKHGSDSGAYDLGGHFRAPQFDGIFDAFDAQGQGSLGAGDLWRLAGRNRVAADAAGWTFAMMEWATTWLLLQRGGRVPRADLRACYDGTLFWDLERERLEGTLWGKRGYGVGEFYGDVVGGGEMTFWK